MMIRDFARPFHFVAESLFGFDFFISYSWRGGGTYARALFEALSGRGMRCFLDRSPEGFTAGGELKAETDRAIRHSSALIVVAEPDAFGSRYVPTEVAKFEGRGCLIIPIDVEGTLVRARADAEYAGSLTATPQASAMLAALINKIGPQELTSRPEAPSPEVIDKLVQSFHYTRRMIRRMQVYGASAALFAVVAVVAVAFMLVAIRRAHMLDARRLLTLAQTTSSSLPQDQRRMDIPDIFPQRKLLLATEAIKATRDHGEAVLTDAENTLREAILSIQGGGLCAQAAGITTLAITPDNRLVTAGEDLRLRLWDLARPDVGPAELGRSAHRITALASAPDGRLVTASDDGTVGIWDRNSPRAGPRILRGHDGRVLALAFAPDGRLITGGTDGRALAWDLNRPGAGPSELVRQEGPIKSLAFFAVQGWLASGGEDGRIYIWYAPGAKPPRRPRVIDAHPGGVTAVAFTPDPKVVSCGRDGTVTLRDLYDREDVRTIGRHVGEIHALAFAPDGRPVTAGADRVIRVWNLDPHRRDPCDFILHGHDGPVTALAFAPDGRLISGSRDGTVRAWDLADPVPEPALVHAHEKKITSTVFLPDGQLATSALDGKVRILKFTRRGVTLRELAGPSADPRKGITAMVATSGGRLITGRADGTMQVWNDLQGQPTLKDLLPGPTERITEIALSGDGQIFAGTNTGSIWSWDLDRPRDPPRPLAADGDSMIKSLRVSPDGRILLARSADNTMRGWDLTSKSPQLRDLPERARTEISAMAFALDGRLVTGEAAGQVRLWDLRRPRSEPTVLRRGGDPADVMDIGPDGRLYTSGYDGVLRVQDLSATAPSRIHLRRTDDKVVGLLISSENFAIAPDGRRLVMQRGESGTVEVWTLELDALLDLAGDLVGRNLTREEWSEFFPDEDYRRTFARWPEAIEAGR